VTGANGATHQGGRMLHLSGLPLDRAVQHTGTIDPANPIEEVIAFGPPTTPPPAGLGTAG